MNWDYVGALLVACGSIMVLYAVTRSIYDFGYRKGQRDLAKRGWRGP